MRKEAKCLYVMAGGGFHKIGIANDPKRRQRELNLPFELEIIHILVMENPLIPERILHSCFAHKQTRGEWFILDSIDVILIKSLKTFNDFLRLSESNDLYTFRFRNDRWGLYHG